MTAAASEHSDYDVPKPPRSLKVSQPAGRPFIIHFPFFFSFPVEIIIILIKKMK